LEQGGKGYGDFGTVLYARLIDDGANIMGIVCPGDEIGLEVEQFIIEAVADVSVSRGLMKIGMGIANPGGLGTGFYIREGQKMKR
jgi:hypothetical protein